MDADRRVLLGLPVILFLSAEALFAQGNQTVIPASGDPKDISCGGMECWDTSTAAATRAATEHRGSADAMPKAQPGDRDIPMGDGTTVRISADGKTTWATDLDGNVTCRGAGCSPATGTQSQTAGQGPAAQRPIGQSVATGREHSNAGPVATADSGRTDDGRVTAAKVQVPADVISQSLAPVGGGKMNALATAPTGLSVARSAEIASAQLRGSFGAEASPAIGALKTAAVIGTPGADRPDGELDLNRLYDGGTRQREFRPVDVVSSTLFKQ